MLLFEQSIGARLLADYGNEPHAVHEWTLKLAKCKGRPEDRKNLAHQEGWEKDQLDGIYETNVVLPLEELILDRAHIEKKMDAAVSRHGQPGSDIQPLIHRCDWDSLAATLVKDRHLTTRIFPDHGNSKGSHEKIMRGISQIQAKYFSELSSASLFTVSAQASAMSAELALTNSVRLPSHSGSAMSQAEADKGGVIGKVYGTIARGIVELAPRSSVEAAFSNSNPRHGDQSYDFTKKRQEANKSWPSKVLEGHALLAWCAITNFNLFYI